ncbi:DUF2982 domain-containing protein [Vibrio sp. T187]|uniref:DUF2982 domain-containing protein n=1 Tax=Vibrio TaxID=662 RepID=UPI0010C94F4F|nr:MULTISPECIES: DUF2982 domain-containing protein [Vibrio]MBW3694811.1 DUF2982 domain-containing protein [Vibrio sp. T187]
MPTRHLTNVEFDINSYRSKWLGYAILFLCLFLALFEEFRKAIFIFVLCAGCVGWMVYHFAIRSKVMLTLTPTHLQQHFFKGGWVVKWSNIESIGICQYGEQGWFRPLPWIGIKLKDYPPYLDSICPRISTEILLSQRSLLYLGVKQSGKAIHFEDIVLDSSVFIANDNVQYQGLQAMLANRMKYQRAYHGYDIFISTQDLDRSGEEFVGLARRYLAAAEPDTESLN